MLAGSKVEATFMLKLTEFIKQNWQHQHVLKPILSFSS